MTEERRGATVLVDDEQVEIPLDAPAVEDLRRMLTDDTDAMLSIHDAAGDYLYASAAARTILGREPREVVGRSAYEFFHPDDLAAIQESHRRIIETPDTSDITYRIGRSDGTFHEVQTISWTVRDAVSGEETGIVAVTRPVRATSDD